MLFPNMPTIRGKMAPSNQTAVLAARMQLRCAAALHVALNLYVYFDEPLVPYLPIIRLTEHGDPDIGSFRYLQRRLRSQSQSTQNRNVVTYLEGKEDWEP